MKQDLYWIVNIFQNLSKKWYEPYRTKDSHSRIFGKGGFDFFENVARKVLRNVKSVF